MNVNQIELKDVNHTKCEMRILELEAGFKKHEEFFKIVENHSKQLIEVKTKLVSNICVYFLSKLFVM